MAPVFITNIAIYTGTDFAQTYLLEDYRSNSPLDLTGYTAVAQLKRYSSSEKTAEFNISYPNDPTTGRIGIELLSDKTILLKAGNYIYDVLLKDPSGSIVRAIEGTATVKRAVTRY